MKFRFPFARGSERELAGAFLVFILSLFLLRAYPNVLTTLFAALSALVFVIFLIFFRDPQRVPPADPDLLVSPADGRVVALKEVSDPQAGEAARISIFLSLFDVHVNRSPLKARALSVEYHRGDFRHAATADASERNERNAILLEAGSVRIVVRQIAGLVARRIVCWCRPGDLLERGERLGLIKFGSRVDVILPRNAEILVRIGDVVKGGETAIAKLR